MFITTLSSWTTLLSSFPLLTLFINNTTEILNENNDLGTSFTWIVATDRRNVLDNMIHDNTFDYVDNLSDDRNEVVLEHRRLSLHHKQLAPLEQKCQ